LKPSTFGKEYYEACYRDYTRQNPPAKLAFYKRIVEEAVGHNSGVRLLDIGCAFGLFIATLNKSWRTFGTDISRFALRRAATSAAQARFFVGDIAALPCKQAFDCIVAFDCMEHVLDLESAVQSIKSLLRSGGWFIFVVPVYDGPTGPLIHFLDHDTTHVHKKSRGWWLTWASRHFNLYQWRGIYRLLLPCDKYLHMPTTKLRQWTPAIAVVAQNI